MENTNFEEALDRLIIGLGNPGKEYEHTRHSIGALVVKAYAQAAGMLFRTERAVLAHIAKGEDDKGKIFIAYLMTYMNESGKAGERLLRFLRVDPREVLIAFDDIETRWGEAKLVATGGTRGHNGVRSMQASLKTKDFSQLRIGVGHPGGKDVADYVLDRFSAKELEELPFLLERSTEKIQEWILEGVS